VYLLERINAMVKEQGKAVGDSIVNVDTLLNHRIDYTFSAYAGAVLARVVREQHIDVILTAEASGISVAVFTAMTVNNEQWPHPASVVFAKKSRPITLPEGGYHVVDSFSRTKNRPVQLFLGSHVIQPGDKVFIVDDFLAQGTTLAALGDLVNMAQGELIAFGVVLEKTFEHGRDALDRFNSPVYSLVKVVSLDGGEINLAPPSLS
jgi:xanthine phosphoribosyltransferase